MTSLEKRLDGLRSRRTDTALGTVFLKEARLAKSIGPPSQADALSYLAESAAPVGKAYTETTFEECKRIENQLDAAFKSAGLQVTFDHQGSVTNNTHIRYYSDIDLLALCDRFYGLEPPLKATDPYEGDPLKDLTSIRTTAVSALRAAFPKAIVATSKARCISISGGSLARKIDVVSSNWLDTSEYRTTRDKAYRGVQVLDVDPPPGRVKNFPFLHNKRIDDRDTETAGGLRRCIRIIKSIRSDAEKEIAFSSYDIASYCYHIPRIDLSFESDLGLVRNFLKFSLAILRDEALRAQLMVPNETRRLFGGPEGASVSDLSALVEEVVDIAKVASGNS